MSKLRWEPVNDAGEEIEEKLGDVLRAGMGTSMEGSGKKG